MALRKNQKKTPSKKTKNKLVVKKSAPKKKKVSPSRKLQFITTPIRQEDFIDIRENSSTDENYRLADVLAAIRRELEAVAIIAESEERDVPKFHIARAELEFSYSISSLSDKDGLKVVFTKGELDSVPAEKLNHLKVSIIDADVLALETDTATAKLSEKI